MTIANVKDFIKRYSERHPDESFIQPILYLQDMGVNINVFYDDAESSLNGQYFELDEGIYCIPFYSMDTNELEMDNIVKCDEKNIQDVIDTLNSSLESFKELIK